MQTKSPAFEVSRNELSNDETKYTVTLNLHSRQFQETHEAITKPLS